MAAPWKTVRVFISSTFRDMQAERDHLVRFVFPRLREELLPRRIHLVDVDLRWGVTGDQDALGVCREVIDECRPRFMCMLGGRYGWVPPERTESITADEVQYGVLSREAEECGQSFFYFRKDTATARMIEESPGDFREPDGSDSAQKLAALKQSITGAGLPVFIYDADWDAAQERLTGLEAFGHQVHSDLLQSLEGDPELAARFTSEATTSPDEFIEEAEQMEAFVEERTEQYVIGSRESLLRELIDCVTSEGTPNIFVLTGEPGSGKSAFLANFVRSSAFTRHGEPPAGGTPNAPILVTHFIGASTGSTDLRRTLRRLCHELARASDNTEPLPLDIKELIVHFQKLLAEVAGKQRVVLVFDALNQFDTTDAAHWLNWLPRDLPAGVRIVASVIAAADDQFEHRTLAILRTRPGTRVEKLEPLTKADTLAIIEGSLKRYAKRLSPEQLAALLAKPDGYLPLYVLTALEELRTLGTYGEIGTRIRTLPGDTRALFGWILTERLARDPGFRDREGHPCGAALVEKFATCLGVSRHGLSPAELTVLLDPGDPLGNVAAILRLLRPYLMRRGELLDFYHVQFRAAAEAAYLALETRRLAAHRTLATYFHARGPHCLRTLAEMPFHQTQGGTLDTLQETLTSLVFLTSKVIKLGIYDLIQDFAFAFQQHGPAAFEPGASAIHEILCRFSGMIDLTPLSLPNQLHNALSSGQFAELVQCSRINPAGLEHAHKGFFILSPEDDNEPTLSHVVKPNDLAYERQSRCLATCGDDEMAILWSYNQTGSARLLKHQDSVLNVIEFSPDGKFLAAGGDKGRVTVWEIPSGKLIAELQDHQSCVLSLSWSPNGRLLASAGGYRGEGDHAIRVWNVQDWTLIDKFEGLGAPVKALAFSPTGNSLASGGRGTNSCHIYNLSTKTRTTIHQYDNEIIALVWSANGEHYYAVTRDMELRDSRTTQASTNTKPASDFNCPRARVWHDADTDYLYLACGNRILVFDGACNLIGEHRFPSGSEARGLSADCQRVALLEKEDIEVRTLQGDRIFTTGCNLLQASEYQTTEDACISGDGRRVLWSLEPVTPSVSNEDFHIKESNKVLLLFDVNTDGVVKLPFALKDTLWRKPRASATAPPTAWDMVIGGGFGAGFKTHLRTGSRGRLWIVNDSLVDLDTGHMAVLPCHHMGSRLGGIYLDNGEAHFYRKNPECLFEVSANDKGQVVPLPAAQSLKELLLRRIPNQVTRDATGSATADGMPDAGTQLFRLPDFAIVEFSRDDRFMLLGANGGEVALLSTANASPTKVKAAPAQVSAMVLPELQEPISSGAWGEWRDGFSLVAVGTAGGSVKIGRIPKELSLNLTWVQTLRVFGGAVRLLTFVYLDNREYLVAVGADRQIVLVDPENGECLTRILMREPVHTLTRNGGTLYCVSGDRRKPTRISLKYLDIS